MIERTTPNNSLDRTAKAGFARFRLPLKQTASQLHCTSMPIDQLSIRRDCARLEQEMRLAHSPSTEVLVAHLFVETLLDRMISARLPGGRKFLEKGKPNFAQKLLLVHAFPAISDDLLAALTSLNKLRNQLAHNFGRQVTASDLKQLSSTMEVIPELFDRMKPTTPRQCSGIILSAICGTLATCASQWTDLPAKLARYLDEHYARVREGMPSDA